MITAATLGLCTAARGGSVIAQTAYKGLLVTEAATGGYQAGQGINAVREGDTVNGAIDILAGSLRVGGSILSASEFTKLAKSTASGPASKIHITEAVSQDVQNGVARPAGGVKAAKTASQTARALQGNEKYPGVDRFRDITLRKGKIVYGGVPGQTAFYTTESGLARANGSRSVLFQGLQVVKNPKHGYRAGVMAYEVLEDTPAAFARTLANPQHGPGGLPQIVIPDYETVLRPLYYIQLGQ